MKLRKGTYEESGVIATYTYTPAEPEVRYYRDGSGHPGSDAEVEISKIEIDDIEVFCDGWWPNNDPPEGMDDYYDWLDKNEPVVMENIINAILRKESSGE